MAVEKRTIKKTMSAKARLDGKAKSRGGLGLGPKRKGAKAKAGPEAKRDAATAIKKGPIGSGSKNKNTVKTGRTILKNRPKKRPAASEPTGRRLPSRLRRAYIPVRIITAPARLSAEKAAPGFIFRLLKPLARPLMKITALFLIVLLNWFGLSAVGRSLSYFNDEEALRGNLYRAGLVDFELNSPDDFLPAVIFPGENAARTIVLINHGNLFKYTVLAAELDGPACDYFSLKAESGGNTEYYGPLADFGLDLYYFEDSKDWNFTAYLISDAPAEINGESCEFDFVFFGSQTRHDLPLGKGFYDREEIANRLTARIIGAPAINIAGGNFCDEDDLTIELTTEEADGAIIYTRDGTEPICGENGENYETPFIINETTDISARVCVDGRSGPVGSWQFVFAPEYCGDCSVAPGDFCSQSMGGWGAPCAGGNPGCLRDNYWGTAVGGALSVGGAYRQIFSGPAAVKNYLPAGGAPGALTADHNDPLFNEAGVFGGQVTALKLNVLYSAAGLGLSEPQSAVPLGDLIINSGPFAGWPVSGFLSLAEAVLGGQPDILGHYSLTIGDINDTADRINNNFTDCAANNAYLSLPGCHPAVPYCGDGRLDPGEECDDGNHTDGDGCSAICAIENGACVPSEEVCDGTDNDCDGIIDNVYRETVYRGPAFQANLDDGADVTDEVEFSDDIYAVQDAWPHTKYIYLKWLYPDIPDEAEIKQSKLRLEHHENKVSLTVQWKDSANEWQKVCTPPKSKIDIVSTCDLSPYLDTPEAARSVNLRLRIVCLEDCEEYLDWADLEITVRAPYDCPECGNGLPEEGEECDDGNNLDGDGCSADCRLEYSDCLKINEVYYYPGPRRTANGKAESDPKNEWIELYNACPFGLNLKNWRLADNAKTEIINDDLALSSGQYAVITAHRSTWKFWPQIPSTALKITLNKPFMFNGLDNAGDAVFLYDPAGNRADSVSWGYNASAFSPSVPVVEAGHSISRKSPGFDTDTAADWVDTNSGSNPPGPNPGTNPHTGGDSSGAGNNAALVSGVNGKLPDESGEEGGNEPPDNDDPPNPESDETLPVQAEEGALDNYDMEEESEEDHGGADNTPEQEAENREPSPLTEEPDEIENNADDQADQDLPAPATDSEPSRPENGPEPEPAIKNEPDCGSAPEPEAA